MILPIVARSTDCWRSWRPARRDSPRRWRAPTGTRLSAPRAALTARVSEAADPAAAAGSGGAAIDIAVVADLDCTEGCRLERIGDAIVVHGDAPLGVQYGLAAMHHPRPLQITSDNPNATIYQFGYLKMGHDLCYWNRERAQVRNLVLGTTEAVPPCVF